MGNQEEVIELIKGLKESNWRSAVEKLISIGEPAVEALIGAMQDEDIRDQASRALYQIGGPSVMPLVAALDPADTSYCSAIIKLLGQIDDPRAIEPLKAFTKENAGNDFISSFTNYTLGSMSSG
jgi:HEAT repeat protein